MAPLGRARASPGKAIGENTDSLQGFYLGGILTVNMMATTAVMMLSSVSRLVVDAGIHAGVAATNFILTNCLKSTENQH